MGKFKVKFQAYLMIVFTWVGIIEQQVKMKLTPNIRGICVNHLVLTLPTEEKGEMRKEET